MDGLRNYPYVNDGSTKFEMEGGGDHPVAWGDWYVLLANCSIRRALGFCETLKGEGGPQNTPDRSPQIAQRISKLAIIITGIKKQKPEVP